MDSGNEWCLPGPGDRARGAGVLLLTFPGEELMAWVQSCALPQFPCRFLGDFR